MVKIGDRFECKDFLGFVFVTAVSDAEICLTYEHVSGENYHDKISVDKFNLYKCTGHFYGWM